MSEPTIDRRFGRQAFGASPDGYHAGRPDYPDWVFQTLRERCGLARGVAVFEIGAGTGKATRRLLDLGADPAGRLWSPIRAWRHFCARPPEMRPSE